MTTQPLNYTHSELTLDQTNQEDISDLIPYEGKFPLIESMDEEIERAMLEVGGSAQTLFQDVGGIIRSEKNPIKRASLIMAQIDTIDNAIIQNAFKYKRGQLKIREYQIGQKRAVKYYKKALERKEHYLRMYKEITDKTGPLTNDKVESAEPRSRIMLLFSQALCDTYGQGKPSVGQYLFADELQMITEDQIIVECMNYVFGVDDKGNQVMRMHTVQEREKFLEEMADKYAPKETN